MIQTAAIAALELAANRALGLDPSSRARLAALAGNTFHFHCTEPPLDLYLLPQSDRLGFAAHWEGEVTATLSGSAQDFAKLLAATDPAAELINGKLIVRGDSHPLQELQQIIKQLDLDWEQPLTRALGDVAGHTLAQGLRSGFSLLHYAGRQLQRQLRDYVVEESDWLAPRWQVEQFNGDVDQLVMDCDRLDARVQRLRVQLAQRR